MWALSALYLRQSYRPSGCGSSGGDSAFCKKHPSALHLEFAHGALPEPLFVGRKRNALDNLGLPLDLFCGQAGEAFISQDGLTLRLERVLCLQPRGVFAVAPKPC